MYQILYLHLFVFALVKLFLILYFCGHVSFGHFASHFGNCKYLFVCVTPYFVSLARRDVIFVVLSVICCLLSLE